MNHLLMVKVLFVLASAVAALVLTVATARERRTGLESIRSEYAMPKVVGYGLAVLFGLMSLSELGHLVEIVRGGQM